MSGLHLSSNIKVLHSIFSVKMEPLKLSPSLYLLYVVRPRRLLKLFWSHPSLGLLRLRLFVLYFKIESSAVVVLEFRFLSFFFPQFLPLFCQLKWKVILAESAQWFLRLQMLINSAHLISFCTHYQPTLISLKFLHIYFNIPECSSYFYSLV